jgi:hypothetical protein
MLKSTMKVQMEISQKPCDNVGQLRLRRDVESRIKHEANFSN